MAARLKPIRFKKNHNSSEKRKGLLKPIGLRKTINLRTGGKVHLSPLVISKTITKWGCSSVGRAPALQAGGHEFESHHLHLPGNKTVFRLHKHHCAKCCIMREPLLELIWYLENFIQRLIRYLLSRHPRKTETRTKVQAF